MSFVENCLQMTLKFSSQTHDNIGQNGTSLFCLHTEAQQSNIQNLGETPTDQICVASVPTQWFQTSFVAKST